MAMIESLLDFQFIAFVPHLFLYEFYLFFKYMIIFAETRQTSSTSFLTLSLGLLATCCCCFCCCCNCCFRKKGYFGSTVKKLYNLSQKLNRFLVKVLFGPKEGIVERFPIYKKDIEDDDGIPILYIRNMKLSQREISLLAVLIMAFGLLAAITAWDSYFLDETYLCSEKSDVSCFPVAIDVNAYDEDEFNITDAQTHRITDCSYWLSENVSSQVTFICFQWVFDSKAVISDVGGLLTMFLITMKITSSGSLAFLNWAIMKCSKKKSDGEEVNKDAIETAKKIFRVLRHSCVYLSVILEMTLGIALIIITSIAAVKHDSKLINFFYEHGNQLLLVFGIFNTLLFLPLEEYAMAEEMSTSTYNSDDEEKAFPNDKNEYQPLTHITPSRSHNPQSRAIAVISLTPDDL